MYKTVAGAAIVAAILLANSAVAQVKWDAPTDMPPSNPVTQNMELFAKEISEATQGKLSIVVHPSGTLFKGSELPRALRMSQVSIGEMPSGILENQNAIFSIDSLPLLSKSFDEAYKLWQVQKPYVERELGKQGIIVLYTMPSPPQGLFADRAINTKADLAGLKWRAYDPVTARIGSGLGAQPVTIALSELSQALGVGMVQAFPTSARTGVDMKAWENVKYFYTMDLAYPKRMVLANEKDLEALGAEIRNTVLELSAKAEKRGWQMVRDDTDNALEALRANGVVVSAPSPELVADMQQVAKSLEGGWLERAGADGRKILDSYRK